MARYDQLFALVPRHQWRLPAQLAEALSVERLPEEMVPEHLKGTLRRFRHLNQQNRVRAALVYWRHHPNQEETTKLAEPTDIWSRFFLTDKVGLGSNHYDAEVGEWILCDPSTWRPVGPFVHRCSIPRVLPTTEAIAPALIRLAIGLKAAFRLQSQSHHGVAHDRFELAAIALNPSDEMAAFAVSLAPHVYNIQGVPSNVALLFPSANPEENGLINEQVGSPGFGVAVWGRFCAIEVVASTGFELDPTIQ